MPSLPKLLFPRCYFLAVASRVDVDSSEVAVECVAVGVTELQKNPGRLT